MLSFAVITINLALVFYTIGVWTERKQKILKKWHVAIFWIGYLFDTVGTNTMSKIAGNVFEINFHGITGVLAILLMLFHASWATLVFAGNNSRMKRNFHKFSIFVWYMWLVPFLSGAIFGMMK